MFLTFVLEGSVEDGLCDVIDGGSGFGITAFCQDGKNDVAAKGSTDARESADVGNVTGFAINFAAVGGVLEESLDRSVVSRLR